MWMGELLGEGDTLASDPRGAPHSPGTFLLPAVLRWVLLAGIALDSHPRVPSALPSSARAPPSFPQDYALRELQPAWRVA